LDQIDRPILLGVVDLFMPHNSIERVAWIAQKLEEREWLPGGSQTEPGDASSTGRKSA
jgi:hypothetical protein